MPKLLKRTFNAAKKAVTPSRTAPKAFLGFPLQAPAYIAAVAYAVLVLTILFPFEFPAYDEVTGQEYIVKYDLGQRLIALLLMTIPIALSIYTINCMMAGNCMVWSYVVSAVTVVWVAIFVVTAMMYTFKAKQEGFNPNRIACEQRIERENRGKPRKEIQDLIRQRC